VERCVFDDMMNELTKLTIFFLSLGAIFFTGCVKEAKETTIINIDTEFALELQQQLQAGKNPMQIVIKTIQEPNCSNSKILYRSEIDGTQIDLSIKGISDPDPCFIGSQNISEMSNFFLANGTYNMDITVRDVIINSGIVEISNEKIKLDLQSLDGIKLGKSEVNIIPDDYFWGTISFSDPQHTSAALAFESDLKATFQDSKLSEGNYSHFEINNGAIQFPDQEATGDIQIHFILQLNYNKDQLDIMLGQFRELNPGINLVGFTGFGESI